MKNKTILVVGALGMLGGEVVEQLRRLGCNVLAADCGQESDYILDITDSGAVETFIANHKPEILFNCAAWTDVDGAEANEAAALAVNGDAVGNLARACKDNNTLLVHVSTDYVFDGKGEKPYKVGDAVGPLTAYGRTKLAGEKQLQDVGGRWIIVRSSWLIGGNGKNFVDTIADVARGRESIKVVNDQIGSPTFVPELGRCLITLAVKGEQGIFHFCNWPACSWYDLACETVKLAGIACEVKPCTTDEFPRPAPRPGYSVLDCAETLARLDWKPTPWPQALRTYLKK